jgi:hypothetical protein
MTSLPYLQVSFNLAGVGDHLFRVVPPAHVRLALRANLARVSECSLSLILFLTKTDVESGILERGQ